MSLQTREASSLFGCEFDQADDMEMKAIDIQLMKFQRQQSQAHASDISQRTSLHMDSFSKDKYSSGDMFSPREMSNNPLSAIEMALDISLDSVLDLNNEDDEIDFDFYQDQLECASLYSSCQEDLPAPIHELDDYKEEDINASLRAAFTNLQECMEKTAKSRKLLRELSMKSSRMVLENSSASSFPDPKTSGVMSIHTRAKKYFRTKKQLHKQKLQMKKLKGMKNQPNKNIVAARKA